MENVLRNPFSNWHILNDGGSWSSMRFCCCYEFMPMYQILGYLTSSLFSCVCASVCVCSHASVHIYIHISM